MIDRRPYFPFYFNDFFGSERVMAMTDTEAMIYLRLLGFCWDKGSIPSDRALLAKMTGRDQDTFDAAWIANVEYCFEECGDDRLHNPRMTSERDRVANAINLRRAAGAKGGYAKATNRSKTVAMLQQCQSNAIAMPEVCQSNATAMPQHDMPEQCCSSAYSYSSSSSSCSSLVSGGMQGGGDMFASEMPVEARTPMTRTEGRVATAKGLSEAAMQDFEAFWKAYPRKTAKAEARKAWEQKKEVMPTVDALIEAVTRQVRGRQWSDPKYIPHASTWLRGERWGDEPDTRLRPTLLEGDLEF